MQFPVALHAGQPYVGLEGSSKYSYVNLALYLVN